MLKFILNEGAKLKSSFQNKYELLETIERVGKTVYWTCQNPRKAYLVIESHVISLEMHDLAKDLFYSSKLEIN